MDLNWAFEVKERKVWGTMSGHIMSSHVKSASML